MGRASETPSTISQGGRHFFPGMTGHDATLAKYLDGPTDIFDAAAVANLIGRSDPEFLEMVAKGDFPQQETIGADPPQRGWRRETINRWLAIRGGAPLKQVDSGSTIDRIRAELRPYLGSRTDEMIQRVLLRLALGPISDPGILQTASDATDQFRLERDQQKLSDTYQGTNGRHLYRWHAVLFYLIKQLEAD